MSLFFRRTLRTATLGALLIALAAPLASAETISIDFESYTLGSPDGQDGWTRTGTFDHVFASNTYGFGTFGSQSLRISDAITSGSFGDQTFAKPLADAVGETGATAGSYSVGNRQTHFEVQFDIASTSPTEQSGMHVSMSPDRGDGSRMSYLRFDDTAAGIEVYFDDVSGTGSTVSFDEALIATLDRSTPHTVKLVLDVLEGPSNDVVKVYIDTVLEHTGTSWENYYRYDTEASAEQSVRIVKTVIFRTSERFSGDTHPANSGNGFLFDNMTLSSPAPPFLSGIVAYDVPAVIGGNQNWTGSMGMDFDVTDPITIKELGAFDDNGDGIVGTISVRLYDRTGPTLLASTTLTGSGDPLIGSSRFKDIVDLPLGPGQYCIVADGYSASDANANTYGGPATDWTTHGGGAINFVGLSRFDNSAGGFPTIIDTGPVNRYAAGTFIFDSSVPVELSMFSVE